jgi:hypothetical protein
MLRHFFLKSSFCQKSLEKSTLFCKMGPPYCKKNMTTSPNKIKNFGFSQQPKNCPKIIFVASEMCVNLKIFGIPKVFEF